MDNRILILFGLLAVASAEIDGIGFHLDNLIQQHEEALMAMRYAHEADDGITRADDDTPTIITKNGYPAETHTITTEDGYIMDMHRIPFGKNDPPVAGEIRPAVLLQHGLLCSSADWVIAIPEKSLGYILADAGYDVWLGNYRGNTYGRNHISLDPDKRDFWHFSWDQNGKFDIPAMIDTILLFTGQEKIHYVGHSMGTTGFMVMLNERPEYADKIIMANLLAPVAYVEHMISPIRFLAPFAGSIEWIAEFLGLGEFLPSSLLMDILADLFCDPIIFPPLICESILFLLCGFDAAQMNETLLEDIAHHTPAGTSTFTVLQYAQEVSGGFHKYDMGNDNPDIYGQDDPPEYDLAKITTPISLYWSQNDWLAQPADVLSLVSGLPNIFDDYEVPYDNWNHLDYLYGIDANTLVYPQVLSNMERAANELGKK